MSLGTGLSGIRLVAACLSLLWVPTTGLAQSGLSACLAEAQRIVQVPGESSQRRFLIEGESARFTGTSRGCIGAVAVAPLHARLRLTLFAANGEALASSEEQANSAYALRCGYEGDAYLVVEMLRGAGEVQVAMDRVAGNQRQRWEARSGTCFSPPVGVAAPDQDVGPEHVGSEEEHAAARMDPWMRRGWQPVGVYRGSELRVHADGCVRLFALSHPVEVPRIRRRGSSLAFCLDGASSFRVRMDSPGAVAVMRRQQFQGPQNIPSVLWSEARAQGALHRRVRVHGRSGETWEDRLVVAEGCHRVVAFGRGAVLSVRGVDEPLRQRRVDGWSQVLFCGAGEWRIKLRFVASSSDVRLFVGDL